MAALPADMPRDGEPIGAVVDDFENLIAPGLLNWNHRGFFGFFPSNTSGPAAIGSLLASAINVNPFSWNAGPSATELEMRVIDWLGRGIGLPWKGSIQDTASSATLCAVIAAREAALRSGGYRSLGAAPQLMAYVSTEAHSSVAKAVYLAGMGPDAVRQIPTRSDLSLDPNALEAALVADSAKGLLPFFVCSTLGTTSTTAFDDVAAIADAIGSSNIKVWHHVDAALAGSAALLPEMAWMMAGCDRADSFVFNPHKWLMTSFDCSVMLVKNPDVYKSALSVDAAYLTNHAPPKEQEASTPVEDFRNWSIQLGHGFRGLKLWFVLRIYGRNGIESLIRNHLALTQQLYARFCGAQSIFVTLCAPRLNTICFRLHDEPSSRLCHRMLIERGNVYLTPTVVNGVFWMRIAIGQTAILPIDIDHLWQEVQSVAALAQDQTLV